MIFFFFFFFFFFEMLCDVLLGEVFCTPCLLKLNKDLDFTTNNTSGIASPERKHVLFASLRLHMIDISSFRENTVTNITPSNRFLNRSLNLFLSSAITSPSQLGL